LCTRAEEAKTAPDSAGEDVTTSGEETTSLESAEAEGILAD